MENRFYLVERDAAQNRRFAGVALLALLAEACSSPAGPARAPARPPSLLGYTTTTVDRAKTATVPVNILLITEDEAVEPLDQEKEEALTFVDHLNAIYERTAVRFTLRSLQRFRVERRVWDSHLPLRTVLPSPKDSQAFTLYLVPTMTTRFGAALNGAVLGPRAAAIGLNARLTSAGTAGLSEPTVRVAGHLLGSMFGLAVSKDPKNLMALGTTGIDLDATQAASLQVPTDLVLQAPADAREAD
jgi:hypothetical protein